MKIHTHNRIYLLSVVALLLMMLLAIQAQAGKLTLSNKASVPAQYSTWADAYNAAQPGDTIFIMPSPTGYGRFDLYKGLTLIGTGHRSVNEQAATERAITSDINLYAGSSGTSIIGLEVASIYTARYAELNNVSILNCRVKNHLRVCYDATNSNWVIDGNLFTGGGNWRIHSSGTSVILGLRISNNMFTNGSYIGDLKNSNIIINNNIFLSTWASTYVTAISNSTNLIISNNIFIGRTVSTNVNNCTITNNLWYAENQSDVAIGDNYYAYNTFDQQPLFVNYDANTHNGNYSFNDFYNFDFTLQSGSPGAGAGTNGANLGLEPNFSITGTSSNPQITYFQALSTTVKDDGTIDVKIKAISGSN